MANPRPLQKCCARLAGAAGLLLATASLAVDSLSTELTARLGGRTLLTAPAESVVGAVGQQAKATPKKSGRIVQLVLASGRADAYRLAAPVVATAIGALGEKPAPNDVAKIVSAAVKATPTEVLPIVKTAVHAAPGQENANAIVKAAVRSVPDPNEKIALHPEQAAGDHKNVADHKAVRDGKTVRDGKGGPAGESLPVKDAVVKAVSQADPTLDLAQLQTASNAGVLAGPMPFDSYDPSDPSIDRFPLVSRLGGGFVSGPQPPAIPTPFPTPPKKPISP